MPLHIWYKICIGVICLHFSFLLWLPLFFGRNSRRYRIWGNWEKCIRLQMLSSIHILDKGWLLSAIYVARNAVIKLVYWQECVPHSLHLYDSLLLQKGSRNTDSKWVLFQLFNGIIHWRWQTHSVHYKQIWNQKLWYINVSVYREHFRYAYWANC